jgi:hypothetical protein
MHTNKNYSGIFRVTILHVALIVMFVICGCDNDRGIISKLLPLTILPSPTVIYTTPAHGSSGMLVNRNIIAAFSEPMAATTVTDVLNFTLSGPGASSVAGSITYDESTRIALFTPSVNFSFNTSYTGMITIGARNLAGTSLASDFAWTFTTGSAADSTAPLLVNTSPAHTAVTVPLNQIISATFNEQMNPLSIIYTMTAPGPVSVPGNMTYTGTTALFRPLSYLASDTLYTITVAGSDLADNPWTAGSVQNPWTFTTRASTHSGPEPITLGTAGTFRVLAGSTITNTGITDIDGDVGLYPGTLVAGFPPGTLTGSIYSAEAVAETAKADLLIAYNDALSRSANAITLPGQIGGLTLAPGLYVNAGSSGISGTAANGILTLDAHGDPYAVWIFKMGSTLITDAGTSVVLTNSARAENIFWQVGSSATLGTNSIFYGTIISYASITITTGATLHGRALTRVGAVTLDTNQLIP